MGNVKYGKKEIEKRDRKRIEKELKKN